MPEITDAQLAEFEAASKAAKEAEARLQSLETEKAAQLATLKELEEFKKSSEQANLSEQERLTAALAEATKAKEDAISQAEAVKQSAKHSIIRAEASRLGFHAPDDAPALLNLSAIKEDNSNITTLLEDLVKSKPYLVKADGGPGPSNSGNFNPKSNANQATLEAANVEKHKAAFSGVFNRLMFPNTK